MGSEEAEVIHHISAEEILHCVHGNAPWPVMRRGVATLSSVTTDVLLFRIHRSKPLFDEDTYTGVVLDFPGVFPRKLRDKVPTLVIRQPQRTQVFWKFVEPLTDADDFYRRSWEMASYYNVRRDHAGLLRWSPLPGAYSASLESFNPEARI